MALGISENTITTKAKPLCQLFGVCGGCRYQDIPYEEELVLKSKELRELFAKELELDGGIFEKIVPSPQPYYYRNRLDLTFRKDREDKWQMGFMLENTHKLEDVAACSIARREINDFLPRLKEEAVCAASTKYRNANLVVRVGEEGKVFWGGIGRHSLRMKPEDYFSVTVKGRKIFYSLDTFFQANLSILERVVETLEANISWTPDTVFLDLYSGVGLFGIAMADRAKEVVMIESGHDSVKLARHNAQHHGFGHVRILEGQVETYLPEVLKEFASKPCTALIDPPRTGLFPLVIETLNRSEGLGSLCYLSCSPEALVRDLKKLVFGGWKIKKIIPFDFFPRTKHLETLACLTRR